MYTHHIVTLLFVSTALAVPKPITAADAPSVTVAADVATVTIVADVPTIAVTAAAPTAQVTAASQAITTTRALTVWPSPVPEPSPIAGVYICEDVNWSGTCTHIRRPTGGTTDACIALNGAASSIGPDPGFTCFFYDNSFCNSVRSDGSDTMVLTYLGSADLGALPWGDWNDRVLSYHCFKDWKAGV